MALTPGQLNDYDDYLLDLLSRGRVSPAIARKHHLAHFSDDALAEMGIDVPLPDEPIRSVGETNMTDLTPVSRQYLNQRLVRLCEHDHVVNLYGTGTYELRSDPRST